MRVKVKPSDISGTIVVPASKSFAHRTLISTFLSGSNLSLGGRLEGKDVEATATCLLAMAQQVYPNDGDGVRRTLYSVLDSMGASRDIAIEYSADGSVIANAHESGSTLRFLLPVAAALGAKVCFVGEGRLPQRPIKELIDVLNAHGADIDADSLPLTVRGKLQSGEYVVPGNISSQYISGLLMALPLLEGDSVLKIVGESVSQSYINITLSVLKRFGVFVQKLQDGYYIMGGQEYLAPEEYSVEGDWSSAGFLLVAGALKGNVSVKGLFPGSVQGDRIIVQLLQQSGIKFTLSNNDITFFQSKPHAVRFNARDYPDVVPILSILLAFATGTSIIDRVERLRDKESDRLEAIINMLSALGIKAECVDDILYIKGGKPKAGVFDSCNDHRMAMSAIIGALCCEEGESIINGAECIAKSYPDFIEDIRSLGGNISEENS